VNGGRLEPIDRELLAKAFAWDRLRRALGTYPEAARLMDRTFADALARVEALDAAVPPDPPAPGT
jgi:hypothetical protein